MAFVPQNGKHEHEQRRGPRHGGSPWKGERVRFTLRVPRSFDKRIKTIAASEGIAVNDLMIRWLEGAV